MNTFIPQFWLITLRAITKQELYLFQPVQSKDLSCRHPANKIVYNEPVLSRKPRNSHLCALEEFASFRQKIGRLF